MSSKRLLFNQSWSNSRPPLHPGLGYEGNDLANAKAPNLPVKASEKTKLAKQKSSSKATLSENPYYYMSKYWMI